MTIPINALITPPRGLSFVYLCGWVCVTVLWCPTGLRSAQMDLFSCQSCLLFTNIHSSLSLSLTVFLHFFSSLGLTFLFFQLNRVQLITASLSRCVCKIVELEYVLYAVYNLQLLTACQGHLCQLTVASYIILCFFFFFLFSCFLLLLRISLSVEVLLRSGSRESWFCSSSNSYTVEEAVEIKSIWAHRRAGEWAQMCVRMCVFMWLCFSAQDFEVKCVRLLPGCWAVTSD